MLIDDLGVVRVTFKHAAMEEMFVRDAQEKLQHFLAEHTSAGASGAQIPGVHLAVGPRLLDFSGLVAVKQVLVMGELELCKFAPETPVLALAEGKD